MNKQKWTAVILSLSVLYFSTPSLANTSKNGDVIPYGRYLTIKIEPNVEQTDIFSAVIQMHFTPAIQTVGDAINEVLRYSGYSLIGVDKQSLALKNTLIKPLPLLYHHLGPLTLRQTLTVLAGSPYVLHIDPLNRIVDFKLKPVFQK